MNRTCRNCMNAYNSPHTPSVMCWNKEFLAQFDTIDVTVGPGESCGTWSERRKDQDPVRFNEPIQLQLFINHKI